MTSGPPACAKTLPRPHALGLRRDLRSPQSDGQLEGDLPDFFGPVATGEWR